MSNLWAKVHGPWTFSPPVKVAWVMVEIQTITKRWESYVCTLFTSNTFSSWQGLKFIVPFSFNNAKGLRGFITPTESLGSLTSCTWSCCNYRVVAEECEHSGHVIRCWHPLNSWRNCTPWQRMQIIYKEHGYYWSHQISAVATTRWLPRDQTLPLFMLARLASVNSWGQYGALYAGPYN